MTVSDEMQMLSRTPEGLSLPLIILISCSCCGLFRDESGRRGEGGVRTSS